MEGASGSPPSDEAGDPPRLSSKRECDGGVRPRFRWLFGDQNVFPIGLEIISSGHEGNVKLLKSSEQGKISKLKIYKITARSTATTAAPRSTITAGSVNHVETETDTNAGRLTEGDCETERS
ncbi:hypothetical protein L1987_53878 [Smallanthus sonchifolius]|uniref:Uncharacterized protein n=1 Tax=Smallanthus sonchifolius TaxID=185202 RepID=A0ACB9EWJ7_9ASTR|nr:hypothetical protein L1987_53878 [Smallanthus sonchifolius]